jgi:hypothetical protein
MVDRWLTDRFRRGRFMSFLGRFNELTPPVYIGTMNGPGNHHIVAEHRRNLCRDRFGSHTGVRVFSGSATEAVCGRARLTEGEEGGGNDLILLNNSKIPANIYHFELVSAKRSLLGKNFKLGRRFLGTEFSLEDVVCDITVPPHGQRTLNFSEQDHFAWGARLKFELYLRLWLVWPPFSVMALGDGTVLKA